jgi:hypothetical protein
VISHGKAHGHQFATFVPYFSVKILATIASVQNFAQTEVQQVTVTMWTTLISVRLYTKLYKTLYINLIFLHGSLIHINTDAPVLLG